MEEKLKIGELADKLLEIRGTEEYKKWLVGIQEDKKYEKKFPKSFKKKYGIRWVGEVPALPKKEEEDGFEKASKKAKKALSEVEAIQREIGIRLVRKRGESFKDYLKRLKKAKENKNKEK